MANIFRKGLLIGAISAFGLSMIYSARPGPEDFNQIYTDGLIHIIASHSRNGRYVEIYTDDAYSKLKPSVRASDKDFDGLFDEITFNATKDSVLAQYLCNDRLNLAYEIAKSKGHKLP